MAEGIVITHSDIQSFLRCRRAWNWQYFRDFKLPEKLHGHYALGSRVHRGAEFYYRTGGDPVAEHDRLAREDVERLEKLGRPQWEIDQLYKDIVVGRNCLTALIEWLMAEGEDDPYEIEAVEQTVEAPILDGAVTLRGKVDVLFRAKLDGFLYINDLKTDGHWASIREGLERSWQHHVYLVALRLSRPEDVVAGAFYTVLRKVANPKRTTRPLVERFRVPGTTKMADMKRSQLEIICWEMLQVMNDVDESGDWAAYPSPQDACRWCDYRQPCDLIDESPRAAQDMLASVYVKGAKHERYDRELV